MKKQRASLRAGRKKGLRFTAVMLALCLLATNDLNIAGVLSSYAQEAGDGAAAGNVDDGKGPEGIGNMDNAGGEAPGGDGTQTSGNGDSGNAEDGNNAGGG